MNLEAIFAALRRHMEMKRRMEQIQGQHPQMGGQRPAPQGPQMENLARGYINGQMPQRPQMMAPPYTGIMSGQLNRQPGQVTPQSPQRGRYYGGGVRG